MTDGGHCSYCCCGVGRCCYKVGHNTFIYIARIASRKNENEKKKKIYVFNCDLFDGRRFPDENFLTLSLAIETMIMIIGE